MEAEDDEPETLTRILSEIESLHTHEDPPPPLSPSSLSDLLSLFAAAGDDGPSHLWLSMSSRNLPPTSLVRPIASSMDSGGGLLASRAYLDILLSPSSPVHTLFDPLSFLSLLSSIRRSLKPPPPPQPSDQRPLSAKSVPKRKRGRGSGGEGAGDRTDVKDLVRVLERLDLLLEKIGLDRFPDSLKSLVETIAGVPLMAVGVFENLTALECVSNPCFRILIHVLQMECGDRTAATVEVLRSLTPAILLHKTPVQASVLRFVKRDLIGLARECAEVKAAVVYLPRFLVNKAPERAEPRAAAVEATVEIVQAMEGEDWVGFVDYTVKMSRGKPNMRLLAVDLILAMLTSLPDPFGVDNPWGLQCLEVLIERCSDSMAGIRARALMNLAQVVGSLCGVEDGRAWLLDKWEGLDELLKQRCLDEKAAVKKAALVLIMKSTSLLGGMVDDVFLKVIGAACSDPLVSIRKTALIALSEVYRKFPESRVISEWLHAVPRLIMDNESSVQEECENLFVKLVLDRISEVRCNPNVDSKDDLELVLPKDVLALLEGICDGEVAPSVKKICMSLGKKKRLRPTVATALQNIITASESLWLRDGRSIKNWTAPPGAWLLLSEISAFVPKAVGWEFLYHHWELLDQTRWESKPCRTPIQEDVCERIVSTVPNSIAWAGDRVLLLQTIASISIELPPEPAADLAHKLLKRIGDFNMHSTEVDAHVKALRTLCTRKTVNKDEGETLILKWVHQLLSKALKIIDDFMLKISEANKIRSFLTPPGTRGTGKKDVGASQSPLQALIAVFTIGSLILVSPSADLKGIIPLLHTIITSGNSESKTKKLSGMTVSVKQIAPSLYIQSWVTLGKICLVDGKIAKLYIPLFVQELEKSDCAALRNNIVVVMRDYVKWRGVLFLRFLLSLVDESEKIRHLAEYLFGNILRVKAPLLAYNSFVEAIFVLNDCHAHAGHSEAQGGLHGGSRLFTIRGNDGKSRSRRMQIYVSLLKQMAPEHLLATSAKLCAEILAAATDGLLNLDDVTGQSVLQDALQVLACKEMRIHSSRGADSSADMEEEGGDSSGAGALAAARGRVVSQVAKKNLIQNAVPIFIELKRLLESKKSPLTGCLMECLRTLLKDYKNEIEDILVADKQLQKELIYDMHKYEAAAKTRSNAAETISGCSNGVQVKLQRKTGTEADKISATVRSVLKEVNRDSATPPLRSMSVPKIKSVADQGVLKDKKSNVLESLRKRHSFDSDKEN
ncbi:hypothetical protein QJS04_geneDACA019731 [Acorus gramineus]|uniref:Condensin complex subunit 1 C-terminal domain-containing protein n=1 Tax=Acorus gramineus TaxID=55184 RepID=A0AAV9BUK0_ACOGR|nr:hypothetical protein QJS04_geneDACA019731 [Acorus gramineus]